jgi:hypothetical protein
MPWVFAGKPARRYRKLGVLKADAKTSSGGPLFLANAQTIEKAKAAIATHRANQTRARVNLQELSHLQPTLSSPPRSVRRVCRENEFKGAQAVVWFMSTTRN